MLSIDVLESGSKGNCSLIYSPNTLLVVDMGVCLSTLRKGLKEIGRKQEDIFSVFVTHCHSDHIKGLSLLHGKFPIYSGEGTIEGCEALEAYREYCFGDIYVTPLEASHDAPNPLNYLFRCGDTTIAYITDTGMIQSKTLEMIKNCTYYYLESNHDLLMLLKSKRPLCLKERIRGEQGHLSNADSALYASKVIGDKTKAIYLAHLSEECNTPEKAIDSYVRVLEEAGIDLSRIKIIPTKQHESTLGGDQ